MPIPPTSGVAVARQRLPAGALPSFRENGDRSRTHTTAAAVGNAVRAATVLTGSEGRASVLGLHVPPSQLPRLLEDHDRLCGSHSLPGALLQPLSARFPGEVQGVAARDLLVAPESADPARGLPARLQRPLGEQDAQLPAVS